MEQIWAAISASGMTESELARRAGLSRSTLHRLKTGETSPTLATLSELALALGSRLDIAFPPAGDPNALDAARALGDPRYVPHDPLKAQEWQDRLLRWSAAAPDPVLESLLLAGSVACAEHRPGALVLPHGWDSVALASAGTWAKGPWALSGRVGLLIGGHAVRGTDILYTTNVDLARAALTTRPQRRGRTILLPANDELLHGVFTVDGVTFVNPLQIMLDCLGLEEEPASVATETLKEWARG